MTIIEALLLGLIQRITEFFWMADLGRLCGRSPGGRDCSLFLHKKDDKSIAEQKILRLFCLLLYNRSGGSCRKLSSCVRNFTVLIERIRGRNKNGSKKRGYG